MEQVRVLLAGIGGYGRIYLNGWEQMNDPSVTIEGVCEIKPGMEEIFPVIKEKNIPVYHSLEEFYKEHQADLAILATPIHLHHQQVLTCMDHGSNVLVEKPVCAMSWEAQELIEKEKETGLFAAVGYQMNYSLIMRELKQDILDGKFGKPLFFKTLHAYRRGWRYYHRNNWAGKICVDGHTVNDGPVSNSNAHQFQNMLFLLGETMDTAAKAVDVKAELYRANPEVENYDTAAFCVMTDRQIPVYYYTAHGCREAELGPCSEFHFEHAVVYLGRDFGQGTDMQYVAEWKDGRRKVYGEVIYTGSSQSSLQKMHDAIQCARQGGRPVCTVETAKSHLDVVEALAKMPILPVKEEQLEWWELDGDRLLHIRNLEAVFNECFEKNILPSEAGAGW